MTNNHTLPRILVIDDNPIARETFAELLTLDGYLVAVASDGLEALTTIPSFVPDVILLDVMMPVMDGYTVCRRLKSDPMRQHIPIILVTALDSKADLIRGLEAGADEFLSKPVDRAELRARLRTMLRIKQQYDRLQEALQMREELVHMAVHDMRTPLTAIMLHSGLLALNSQDISPELLQSVEAIRSQAQQLNSFANDLLILAKMESGHLTLHQEEVAVSDLVQRLPEQYALLAESLGVGIVVNAETQPYPVQLDPGLFTRVIDNLVSNALKISSRGHQITLNVCYPAWSAGNNVKLRLEVLDQGPGVPAEYREVIFDKFQTVKVKKQGISQTGLGLAFCKMSVEAHHGRIFVTDNQPQGAAFVVEI